MLTKKLCLGLFFGAVSYGTIETVVNNQKDSSPAAALSAFTDIPDITISEPKNLTIKHQPEKYYGASMEERFTAQGAPEIDYPIGPGTFYSNQK